MSRREFKKIGDKDYNLTHPIVIYDTSLSLLLNYSFDLPTKWGDFNPQLNFNKTIFCLKEILQSNKPRSLDVVLASLILLYKKQIETILDGISLEYSIDDISINGEKTLWSLKHNLLLAEINCNNLILYLSTKHKDLMDNLIYMLDQSCVLLELLQNWVDSFILSFSINDKGIIEANKKIKKWSVEEIKSINL